MDEQRRAALRAAEAIRYYLLQPHPATRESEKLRLELLPRLLAATEGMGTERALARDIKRKAIGPTYPGKTHELRALAAKLVGMLEGSDE